LHAASGDGPFTPVLRSLRHITAFNKDCLTSTGLHRRTLSWV